MGIIDINTVKFRKELKKIMPGYKWTVHRTGSPESFVIATGIISKGLCRTSTLQIIRRKINGDNVEYEAKSAGFGRRARWLHTSTDGTLTRALRGLQNHYNNMAGNYRRHELDLQEGRVEPKC